MIDSMQQEDGSRDNLSQLMEESLQKMKEERENKRLTMDHVQGIFYLYIAGISSGVVVFGFELMGNAMMTTAAKGWGWSP